MKASKTLRQGFVTMAKLAGVTVITPVLALTLYTLHANTSSSPKKTKTNALVLALPFEKPLAAKEPDAMDMAMGALSPNNAMRYRAIFAAQKKGDWAEADALMATLTDKRLLGHVLAGRFQRGRGNPPAIKAWLAKYADHPQAGLIYGLAKGKAGHDAGLPQPARAAEINAAAQYGETAVAFPVEVGTDGLIPGSAAHAAVQDINAALRRGDPTGALSVFHNASASRHLSDPVAADASAAIAAQLFYLGDREHAAPLAAEAARVQQPLGLWIRSLIAWEQNDPVTAETGFLQLAGHPSVAPEIRAAGQFWAYRALRRNHKPKEAARQLSLAAAQPRSFYGLLAAGLVHQGAGAFSQGNGEAPAWNDELRAELAKTKAGWRALALIQAGETELAETELRRLDPQGRPETRRALEALVRLVPMPALALQLAAMNGENDAALLYPMLPWSPPEGFQVDRAFLYALARHESLFDPAAVSPRGARGLMQIMPATANGMDAGAAVPAAARLFDPEYNLAMGQKYVRYLAEQPQIGPNLVLLLAAYNTGPAKVARWVETGRLRQGKQNLDPLLFMESIPQRETRQYIARVLPHYWAYRARLDQPLTTLRQLAEGKWPRLPQAGEGDVQQASAPDQGRSIKVASAEADGPGR